MDCEGHSDFVIPEFSLGCDHRADFVVMQSFFSGWKIQFVELEPVDKKIFNPKDKTPSQRLRAATKQINDWRNFEKDERVTLGKKFS